MRNKLKGVFIKLYGNNKNKNRGEILKEETVKLNILMDQLSSNPYFHKQVERWILNISGNILQVKKVFYQQQKKTKKKQVLQ